MDQTAQPDSQGEQKVACRLGIVYLPRQVCYNSALEAHKMPGNAVLPAHQGMLITRNLQEWACMFPLDLPFASVERLLKWQTQSAEMICATEVRQLVRRHGEIIRQAEAAEVEKLLQCEDLNELKARIYIGSGHAEKACDLIVSRRQKHQGMHWSHETADGLAALKTLVLNHGWDLYWQKRKVLPLAVPIYPRTYAR